MSYHAANHARWEKGIQTRERFLDALRQGMTITAAATSVGWKGTQAYYNSRARFPDFAAQADQIRAKRRAAAQEGEVADDMAFAEFTAWAFDRIHLQHQILIASQIDRIAPGEIHLILTWRGAGKTATIEDYICKTLATDPSHRFCIVSRAEQHAKNIIGAIKRKLTDTATFAGFHDKYGPFYEEGQARAGFPWSAFEVRVAKRRDHERDPSVVARGWTSAAHGSRIDTLIVDDVIDRKNLTQSEEILETLRSTYFSSELGMRTVVIGNRIGPNDIYEQMLEAGLITRELIIPAAGGLGTEPGTPTIPEWWDRKIAHDRMRHNNGGCCPPSVKCPNNGELLTAQEALTQLEERLGPRVWQALYQQNPLYEGLTAFGSVIDRCLDATRTVGPLDPALAA